MRKGVQGVETTMDAGHGISPEGSISPGGENGTAAVDQRRDASACCRSVS